MEQQFELRRTPGVGDQQQRKVMKPSKDLWIGSVQKKKSAFGLPIILCSDSQISQGPKDFDQAAPRVNPHALDIKKGIPAGNQWEQVLHGSGFIPLEPRMAHTGS